VNPAQPRIFVAGHRGLVGSAIVRVLQAQGLTNLVTRTRAELELTDQAQVRAFFAAERIDQVYLAAARVGGINANNTYPAEFIYDNTMVQATGARLGATACQAALPGLVVHLPPPARSRP
jgi:GDP-L-fucose synthase